MIWSIRRLLKVDHWFLAPIIYYSTTLSTISGTDQDAGQTLTYSLVAGQGDDNKFSISGTSLKSASVLSSETYTIMIRATDNGSPQKYYDKTFYYRVGYDLSPVYRFYKFNQEVHFFTSNQSEYQSVLNNYSSIYRYEGILYYVDTINTGTQFCSPSLVPVYRFYNLRTGVHFYTANQVEKNNVQTNLSWLYRYEGIAYYSASSNN